MEQILTDAIEAEAKKRISKHSREWYFIHKYRKTFTKRTGKRAKGPSSKVPNSWAFHKHFDPRYCINHSKFISKGIWKSLQNGTYQPTPALRIEIPKANGGVRTIDSFSVPDAAVAKLFLDNLRIRNAKIFSDSSYAYQINKNPLDAVLRLKSAMSDDVLFVSQYDFSAYFDSINHKYLRELLRKQGQFLTTKMERCILESILKHQYSHGNKIKTRRCGIPQGHSLSLFLANVAAHPLDEQLGRLNGTFARFADDTVVVNTSYEDALKTAEAYHRFAKISGVKINEQKSSGIRLFSEEPMEMAHISSFEFLSYKFRRSGLFMADRAKSAIKSRCSKIIYNNLILHNKRVGAVSKKRTGKGFKDWELVTCLNELRSYIYGGHSQASVENFLVGKTPMRNISGAVSYFALIEDSTIFRELDGWLLDALHRGYEERRRIILAISGRTVAQIAKDQLIHGNWYKFPAVSVETNLPSFFTAWRAARKSWAMHGLGGIDVQGGGYAYT